MDLYRFFILLLLAWSCKAGPLVALVVAGVEVFSDVAAAGVAASSFAGAFGVGASAIWYGSYVIVDGALFYGTGAAGAGALLGGAAAGGAVAGVNAHDAGHSPKPVTDPAISKSIMSMISSAMSSASVKSASEASVSSAKSESEVSVSSAKSESKVSVSSAKSASRAASEAGGLESWASEASSLLAKPGITPQKASTRVLSKSEAQPQASADPTKSPAATTPVPASSTIPPPPGTPVSTLPPDQRPSEVPAGVPEYNFRMCQYDIIQMGLDKQNLVFDQPAAQSIRVDNIPSTCMVLATVLLGNPDLGPHPVPMGAASLQWNDIQPDTINLIREGFGLQPMNSTSTPAARR